MLEKVSVLIPYQSDKVPRRAAYKWILKFYEKVLAQVESLCRKEQRLSV